MTKKKEGEYYAKLNANYEPFVWMVSETACSLLTNKGNAGLRVHHHVNETLKPAKGKWQCPLINFLLFIFGSE